MSQFFDQASLVMVPSGYKNGKVYSQKPLSADGQLAFTRSNDTASRIGPDGLIQRVRTNLALQSQTFENASWSKSAGGTGSVPVVTANDATAPDGTATADKIVFDCGAGTSTSDQSLVVQGFTIANATPYTQSIYLKGAVGGEKIVSRNANGTYVLFTLTNSWQRFNGFSVSVSTSYDFQFGIRQGLGGIGTINSTPTIYAWAGQLELSDFGPTTYIPTLGTAVSVGPVANTPRLDYSGGATCPKLLLEGQRTNLYTFSEQLNQWTANYATVTANYAVSPDGYTNADRVQFTAGGLLYISGTGSAGENTLSVYAKATNGTSAKFRFFANGAGLFSSDQTATGEWQRFTFTYTYSALTAGLARPTTNGGVDDVIFYGFQHEIGSHATSYIPTIAATTRGADSCSKTGISSLIGQTEGTLFTEVNFTQTGTEVYILSVASAGSDAITLRRLSTGEIRCIFVAGTSSGTTNASSAIVTNGRYKLAYKYISGSIKLFINGTLSFTLTPTFTFVSPLSSAFLGTTTGFSGQLSDGISQSIFFETALTDAQCIELTSL